MKNGFCWNRRFTARLIKTGIEAEHQKREQERLMCRPLKQTENLTVDHYYRSIAPIPGLRLTTAHQINTKKMSGLALPVILSSSSSS